MLGATADLPYCQYPFGPQYGYLDWGDVKNVKGSHITLKTFLQRLIYGRNIYHMRLGRFVVCGLHMPVL